MRFIHLFLYYTFICSSVLFFGIGLNRSIEITSRSTKMNMRMMLKSLISILLSIIFTYLITQYLLIPIKLAELFPLVALLVFLCINTFVEALVRITTNTSTSEFSISWLVILLSLYESSTLLEALIISFSCMVSFQLMLPIVYCFQNVIYLRTYQNQERKRILVFLSIVVLMLVMSVCDVTWFNVSGR